MHHQKSTFVPCLSMALAFRKIDGLTICSMARRTPFNPKSQSFKRQSIFPSHSSTSFNRLERSCVCTKSEKKRTLEESWHTTGPRSWLEEPVSLLHPNHSWKINKVSLVLVRRSEKQTTRYFLKFMYSTSFCLRSDWKDLLYTQHWSPSVLCRRQQNLARWRGVEEGLRISFYLEE